MNWTDPRLTWKSEKFQEIHLPIDDIWMPDVIAYNLLEAEDYLIKPLAVVYSNGFVLVIPSKKYVVRCTEDKDHLYTCTITFGSWTYSNKDIDLVLSSDQLDLDLYENKDFEIVDSDVVRTEKKYSCCPELYISLKYTIQLRRKV
ncbi:DgyrCDS14976 [Dimorphilus gyrociliatus]|uniref:DgyrCDS14976 n=1 Tax=Dimorphilus gyrociliatus TaxID=2664684 RepID=A0A7I8WFU7_9ANNE|nr:DgyrCDS14976 [Dimorphilus gyrociliatus]